MKSIFILNEAPKKGLKLSGVWQGSTCKLKLTNETDKKIAPGDITLFTAKMIYPKDTEFYGEGYNMLSQYAGTIDNFKLIGSFSDYDHYHLPKPEGINQVYNMAIFYPKGKSPLLIGFCSCNRFSGWVRFNEEKIEIALNCESVEINAGETIDLEEVYINEGERSALLNDFASAINKNHPRLEFDEIPTGWCSWLVYGPNITAKNIYDNLDAIKKEGLDLKYIQIDDGYQAYWGDWFDFTDKFEGGVKKVCLDIKEKGFEPAIWVAPFVAEKDSKLFKEHPDWFVKDENGAPLDSSTVSFGGWRCGPWYILDTTHPDALSYIKTVFKAMREEWQIKYFKLDAIVWESLPFGVRHDKTKTSVEAFKIGMDAIYEATGKDSFILGGNSPMWPAIGKVNGMRVTNDNQRGFYQFKQIGIECFNRNWQHKKLWINDPDTVLLQNQIVEVVGPDGKPSYKEGTVTRDEFLFNAAYTMASGGMVLSGDDISALRDKNVDLLKKLLPPTNKEAEFDNTTFTVGRAKISEEKEIIYIFNFEDYARDIEVRLENEAAIFDLFENKDLGKHKDIISFKEFPPHSAKVLILE